MSLPEFVVRRATVDDLDGLKILWQRARFQVLDLEKRLTEFQLAVTFEGDLLGAVGLQIQGKDGRLHSEALTQPEAEDDCRAALWERVQTLARNHGLVRFWTREQAPFWSRTGFAPASLDALKQLPAAFGDPHTRWFVLSLREDVAVTLSLDQEFELFQQASRASAEEVLGQARKLKVLANIIAVVLFIACVVLASVFAIRYFHHPRPRPAVTEPP